MVAARNIGDFKITRDFLRKLGEERYVSVLEKYGKIGVEKLRAATPVDRGITANSWSYKVEKGRKGWRLKFNNSHMAGDTPVVILIQYGHATGTGGWVEGRDFLSSPTQETFDAIVEEMWREIQRL